MADDPREPTYDTQQDDEVAHEHGVLMGTVQPETGDDDEQPEALDDLVT